MHRNSFTDLRKTSKFLITKKALQFLLQSFGNNKRNICYLPIICGNIRRDHDRGSDDVRRIHNNHNIRRVK